jgi:putative transport protein
MVPIFAGIALGVVIGIIPFTLPGLPVPVKLGLAGGPLLTAIALARIGHIGSAVWYMPPAANRMMREFGISLFLAVVGLQSGAGFLDTLVNGNGLAWAGFGAIVTLVPLLVVGLVGQWLTRANYLSVCGVLAGSMTDPPALAFAQGMSGSEAPTLSYATVYPLVMVLRVVIPQFIALALWAA